MGNDAPPPSLVEGEGTLDAAAATSLFVYNRFCNSCGIFVLGGGMGAPGAPLPVPGVGWASFKRSINTDKARPLYSDKTLTKSKSGLSKSAIPFKKPFMEMMSEVESPPFVVFLANSLNNLTTSFFGRPKFNRLGPQA